MVWYIFIFSPDVFSRSYVHGTGHRSSLSSSFSVFVSLMFSAVFFVSTPTNQHDCSFLFVRYFLFFRCFVLYLYLYHAERSIFRGIDEQEGAKATITTNLLVVAVATCSKMPKRNENNDKQMSAIPQHLSLRK